MLWTSLCKLFGNFSFVDKTVLFFFSFFISVKLEQGTVTSLIEEMGTIKGVQYKTKDGQELAAYAPLTIVCDGCFSNLRRSLCKPKVEEIHSFLMLFKLNCMISE